jgi:hypothetical protein
MATFKFIFGHFSALQIHKTFELPGGVAPLDPPPGTLPSVTLVGGDIPYNPLLMLLF